MKRERRETSEKLKQPNKKYRFNHNLKDRLYYIPREMVMCLDIIWQAALRREVKEEGRKEREEEEERKDSLKAGKGRKRQTREKRRSAYKTSVRSVMRSLDCKV